LSKEVCIVNEVNQNILHLFNPYTVAHPSVHTQKDNSQCPHSFLLRQEAQLSQNGCTMPLHVV